MPELDIHALRRAEAEAEAARLVGSGALVPSLAILLELGAEYFDLLASIQHPPMPPQLQAAFRGFLSQGNLDGYADADATWSLVVEALVLNVVTRPPSSTVIPESERRLRTAPYWVHDAWRDRCANAIRSMEGPKRAAWIAALGVEPSVKPSESKAKAAVTIRRSAAPWKVKSPFELWDQSPARLEGNWYAPLQILDRVDPMSWFHALDSWHDVRLVDTAFFFGALRSSPDRILTCMRAAQVRPEIDVCASVTLLCEEAVDASEELIDKDEGANVDSAREFLETISRVLLARPDGPRIAVAHAARLLGFQILNRNQRGAAKRATELALAETLRHLGLAQVGASAHRTFWTERRNSSRVFVRDELLALFVARRSLEGRPPLATRMSYWGG